MAPLTQIDPQKAKNEALHNQSAPSVLPIQNGPFQVLPTVRQPNSPNPFTTQQVQQTPQLTPPAQQAPAGPQQPVQQQAPQPPTFDVNQAVALANAQPGVIPQQAPGAPAPQPQTPQFESTTVTPQVTQDQITPIGGPSTQDPLQKQVLETAQQKVIEGRETDTQDLTSQRTQELLLDPSLGFDGQENIQSQLSQFDLDRAKQLEAQRRAFAPSLNTGTAKSALIDRAVQSAQERAFLGNELEQQERDRAQQEFIRAITEGRATSETERLGFATDVEALASITGAAEGTEERAFLAQEAALNRGLNFAQNINDQAFQASMANLEGKLNQGLQLSQQDWMGAQNEMDRVLKQTMQGNDINAQKEALQTQLEFNKAMQEAGFEFTASQNALDRGLELSLQTGDQAFQEQMMRLKEEIDLGILTQEQDWQAIQNELNNQFILARDQGQFDHANNILNIQQQFEEAQNDQQRAHELDLSDRRFEQDKWMQSRAEAMQQAGFSQQTSERMAAEEHQSFMQDFEWKKKELMQQGMNEFQAEQQANEFAFRQGESNLDRQLQKEIEAGRITVEEAKLSQMVIENSLDRTLQREIESGRMDLETQRLIQAADEAELDRILTREVEEGRMDLEQARLIQDGKQFESQLGFQRWAAEQGFSQQEADRIWQSGENALARAHDLQMQNIQNDFELAGLNFSAIMLNLQNLPPEQQAQALKQAAIDGGISHTEQTPMAELLPEVRAFEDSPDGLQQWKLRAEEIGISEKDAQTLFNNRNRFGRDLEGTITQTIPGLKALSNEQFQSLQDTENFQLAQEKVIQGQALTDEEYQTYVDQGTFNVLPFEGTDITQETKDARGSRRGKRAHRFKDDVFQYFNNNIGETVKASDGNIYTIDSIWEPGISSGDKGKIAFVNLKSVKDGSSVKMNSDGVLIGSDGKKITPLNPNFLNYLDDRSQHWNLIPGA